MYIIVQFIFLMQFTIKIIIGSLLYYMVSCCVQITDQDKHRMEVHIEPIYSSLL